MFAAVPVSMAVGAWLVGFVDFRPIYAAAAVIPLVAALVVRARGGQARRFTAREAPAWPAADQME